MLFRRYKLKECLYWLSNNLRRSKLCVSTIRGLFSNIFTKAKTTLFLYIESKLEIGSSNTISCFSEFFAFKNSKHKERKFCSPVLRGNSSLSKPKNSFSSSKIFKFLFESRTTAIFLSILFDKISSMYIKSSSVISGFSEIIFSYSSYLSFNSLISISFFKSKLSFMLKKSIYCLISS